MDLLDLLARRLSLHAEVGPSEQAALRSLPFELRKVEAGAYLVREGTPPATCALMVSGYSFRQRITEDGTRQIVSIHVPGEAVDFQNLFLDVADHDVLTLIQATVAIIPRDAIRALALEWPKIGHAILIYTLIEASIFREWIVNVGRRDARARMAHLLCEFAIRIDANGLKDGSSYHLPMTQEQLGDALGLTSIHINRTIRSLEAGGYIVRKGKVVSFPDWEALKAIAGFSDRYLHLKQHGSEHVALLFS